MIRFSVFAFLCFSSVFLWGEPSALAQGRARRPAVVSPWDVEAREYLGTPQSEAAVRRGLAYLASRQEADGHWRSGGYRTEVAITALSLLAYLASGHQPGRGRYGLILDEAVNYLANSVRMDGNFGPAGLIRGGPGGGGPAMYGHGFATLALCEVYGMTRRHDLKPKIQAAVRLIEDTQTQDGSRYRDGGWRYQPIQGDADISVTVVQVLALRAARNAGFKVAQSTIDRAMAYMRRCANNPDGGFSYQVGQQQSGPARTGAGVLSLIMGGLRGTPECQGGLRYLVQHPLDRANEWPYREHFYYALYYVTQAMYQAGGEYWRQWFPTVRDRLVRMQDSDGSWSRLDGYSEAGPEYATAMAVLVLQVPAGLLPIYQK
ncbi:MAG TPA: prenyltransferase/squalene oxidase repeat-containing protein [Chthonomonadaceae bacterium]|nr:prenyltransferase/squalene oxidase repeat-containing protein [Chthonomonadaceae bacterium]